MGWPLFLRNLGVALIVMDVLWVVAFVVLTGYEIQLASSSSSTGFTALASPHTALIPSLFNIMNDLYHHCLKSGGACKLTMPAITFYVIPLLIVPYDVLELAFNVKFEGSNNWSVYLSAYGLFTSTCICLWTWFVIDVIGAHH